MPTPKEVQDKLERMHGEKAFDVDILNPGELRPGAAAKIRSLSVNGIRLDLPPGSKITIELPKE